MAHFRLAATISLAAVLNASSAVAATPVPVRTTPAMEFYPAADEGYVAWSQLQRRRQNVFAQPSGMTAFRVNPSGQASTGGIEGDLLIYQQYAPAKDKSDLKLMDLSTRVRSNAPPGINTPRWEYWPDISEDYILFGRLLGGGDRQVLLYDRTGGSTSILAQTAGWNGMLDPGTVSGDFAAWTRMRYRRDRLVDCEVFVRNLATDSTSQVPNPDNRCQFGASVSDDGTVYYGRSGYGCGQSSGVMEYPLGGPATKLVALPQGRDLSSTYAFTDTSSDDHVFYDPGSCSRPRQDIFKLVIP